MSHKFKDPAKVKGKFDAQAKMQKIEDEARFVHISNKIEDLRKLRDYFNMILGEGEGQ